MRIVLEADIDKPEELARILRYWGGVLKQIPWEPASHDLYDSAYTKVGVIRFEAPE